MIVQQKRRCKLRLVQPPRRLRKTGRCEIKQRQRGKDRKVVHVRIERGDQTRCCMQFVDRLCRILLELRMKMSRIHIMLQYVGESADTQQCKRKSGGQQRIDKSRSRWKKRPLISANSLA